MSPAKKSARVTDRGPKSGTVKSGAAKKPAAKKPAAKKPAAEKPAAVTASTTRSSAAKAPAAKDHAKNGAAATKRRAAASSGAAGTAAPASAPAITKRGGAGAAGLASDAWPGGFGETPADEELFRRGFPHLRIITDEDPADPAKVAETAIGGVSPSLDFAWPKEVARRFVRAFAAADPKYGGASPRDPAVMAALREAGPPGDALEQVRAALNRGVRNRDWRVEDFLFLLEADSGADTVADAVLSVLEEGGPWTSASGGDPLHMTFCLGYLFGRARHAQALRARLVAIREGLGKKKPAPPPAWANVIDTVLDGDRAFDFFGWMLGRYTYVTNAAALAEKLSQAPGEFLPDVRHAYLAGPSVLALYDRRLDELPVGPLGRRFYHQLAPVKRSLVLGLMRRLAARADTKDLAKAWLARN